MSQHSIDFNNRAQVLGVAAKMMRRILLTHEETRRANKRGGECTIVCLTDVSETAATTPHVFSEVDQVLGRLEKLDERQSKVAELKIFGGLTGGEIAEYLNISPATVQRDWISGRAWLLRELSRMRKESVA